MAAAISRRRRRRPRNPQASQTSAKPAAASTAQTPAPQSGAMGAAVMSGGLLAPSDMMNGPEGVAPARSASPPAAPAPTYQKAQVGVGQKGGDYGGGALMKPITTPASVYWRAQERITFDQIKHAMDLYKASNGGHRRRTKSSWRRSSKRTISSSRSFRRGSGMCTCRIKKSCMVEQPAQ